MNELTTLKEGTRVCGSTQTQQSSFTPESPAPSKKPPSKRKRKCSEKPARKESFSATLHLDSIPNDEPLDPYWNEHCRGNQSAWWLPHQTVSPDQASHSSVTSSNYQVDCRCVCNPNKHSSSTPLLEHGTPRARNWIAKNRKSTVHC